MDGLYSRMKSKFRRKLVLLLAVCSVIAQITVLSLHAEDAPDLSHSKNVYLYNITASSLMLAKNADEIIYPGPTVKLMTAAVAIDCLGNNLNKVITIKEEVIDEVQGNNINLQAGEEVTVLQLLNALIIGNSNDAAHVLAVESAGSVGAFVILMNERAQSVGAKNTFYTNPTGLPDEEMVTTVSDTAKIAIYLNRYNIFTEIANKEYYILEETNKSSERKIFNRNYFINTNTEYIYYSPYVTGMNAGYTDEAGYCVVATSYYGSSQYLCIVMGADNDDNYIYSFYDAGLLLNWAYTNFSYMTVLKSSEIICEIPVSLSSQTDRIAVMPETGIDLYLPNDTDIDTDITISWLLNVTDLTAPVEKGVVVGQVTVLYNEKIVGQVDLVTKNAIPRSDTLYMISLVKRFVSTTGFKLGLTAAVIAAVVYIFANAVIRGRKQRREEARRRESERKTLK